LHRNTPVNATGVDTVNPQRAALLG
jgi:hypothetical protein